MIFRLARAVLSRCRAVFYSSFSAQSASLKPTNTTLPSTSSGRFTSIPSVASRASCSSSVIAGSLSFSPSTLYCRPLVLKNFFKGQATGLLPAAQFACAGICGFDIAFSIVKLVGLQKFFGLLAGATFGITDEQHGITPLLLLLL